jgi:F-type H+-transporting ATPase subunit b
MELGWPTFFLQLVNFVVLVWLLKRFLYKPVLEAIARRKAGIDQTLREAAEKQNAAEVLASQYQNRLAEWESEKQKMRAELVEEINAQRAQMMAALENTLSQEREKARVLEERRLNQLENQKEAEAIVKGVQFMARLLARTANAALEARLIDITLEDLLRLPEEQITALRMVSRQSSLQVKVISAYALSTEQRSLITQKLRDAIQDNVTIEFKEDGRLLAGLRISVGPWVLRANLEDELQFFAKALPHE